MINVLRANVITMDVQPLIDKETGDVIFIDFTEARQLVSPPTAYEVAAVVGFCNEMLALVPETMRGVAGSYFKPCWKIRIQLESCQLNCMNLLKVYGWIEDLS